MAALWYIAGDDVGTAKVSAGYQVGLTTISAAALTME